MHGLLSDIRLGLRSTLKNPGLTLAALVALGLGIGANTSMFSFVNAFLLRPLPFAEQEELYHVWGTNRRRGINMLRVSVPDYLDWKEQTTVFEDLAAFNYTGESLTGIEQPERLSGGRLSANTFDLLGARPLIGRTFSPEEDQTGRSNVVLLSEDFWRSRYAGDPDVLGRTIELNQLEHTIIGVMGEEFLFPLTTTELWLPRVLDDPVDTRDRRFLQVFGRLRDGATSGQAEIEMRQIASRLEEAFPSENEDIGAHVVPLRDALNFASDIMAPMSIVLMLASGFVLLIACANVANLLLSRAAQRQREISVRTALGASRWRLIRQLLTESTIVALSGGVVGLGLAYFGTSAMSQTIPDDLYKVGQIDIDGMALLFTLGLCLLTSVAFGLVPALRSSRVELTESLKEGTAGAGSGQGNRRWHEWLIVGEMTLAVVLLVGTALMVQTFNNLQGVQPGFTSEGVLTMTMQLQGDEYDRNRIIGFHEEIIARAQTLPGVQRASTVDFLPLNHESSGFEFTVPGQEVEDGKPWEASSLSVGPGYFEVMGIPLITGREFDERDRADGARAVVINQSMASRFWGDGNPVGAEIRSASSDQAYRVVGVVGDTRQERLNSEKALQVFHAQSQSPRAYFRLLVRTAGNPLAQATPIRKMLSQVDPNVPVSGVRTLQQVVEDFLLPERMLSSMLAMLSTGALILAAVGIYGVMAYFVATRVREIGIRIALGAHRSKVLALVLGRVARLTGIAAVLGLLGGLGVTRLLESFLFGVSSSDPVTMAATVAFLAGVALLAAFVPAYRATRIDPIRALRYE